MPTIAAAGYLLSGAFFLLLSLLMVVNWRGRLQGGLLLLACVVTATWSFALAYQLIDPQLPTHLIWVLETARTLSWLAFIAALLWQLFTANQRPRKWLTILSGLFLLAGLTQLLPYEQFTWLGIEQINDLRVILFLALAIIGISLIEQLFRNTTLESRWTIKFLCLGLGLGFFYDFYLYADALLFKRIDPLIWQSRGAVNALIAPLVAVSARRSTDWSVTVFVSKQVVFHTTGILGAGIYLLSMAFIGYYIKDFGGEYGDFFRLVFFVAAIVMLFVLVSSGQLRAKLKVFLNKHFFKYQYDYREEWLKLINLLSSSDRSKMLSERVLLLMSSIVDSSSGSLWQCQQHHCRQLAGPDLFGGNLAADAWYSALQFMQQTHWIIDLDEYRQDSTVYQGLELPATVIDNKDLWVMAPLLHEDKVHSFVVLPRSRSLGSLNWENRDLLIMAGRQAASYLVLEESARQLAEARQFEGFNRLSAFVMHDLKNLVAQLSLVASNAARHKHNPEFIDDAIDTIENAVGKMNRLMLQLKTAGSTEQRRHVDIVQLVEEVVAEKRRREPAPVLTNHLPGPLRIKAEAERLAAVIGHVIQNAQDATPPTGSVDVSLELDGAQLQLLVADTGSGMDEAFIRERLFKPFDTTKGLTGMGIGAYESREFITALGGEVRVSSEPGEGTRLAIRLPLEQGNGLDIEGEAIG